MSLISRKQFPKRYVFYLNYIDKYGNMLEILNWICEIYSIPIWSFCELWIFPVVWRAAMGGHLMSLPTPRLICMAQHTRRQMHFYECTCVHINVLLHIRRANFSTAIRLMCIPDLDQSITVTSIKPTNHPSSQ